MPAWPNGAPRVGDRATLSRTVEAADIVRFTEISGDRNPVHYDRERCSGRRARSRARRQGARGRPVGGDLRPRCGARWPAQDRPGRPG